MLRRVPACLLIVLLTATLLTAPATQAQTTWYVDDDADPNGDGITWLQPFDELQDALAEAQAGDEIRIAGGRHVPSVPTDPNDPRTATFDLVSGVALYGGYAGLANPSDPDSRDIALYEAILSGDLNADDEPPFGNYADNAYHVVTASGTDATTLLDGFTITGGNATGQYGAGIRNVGGSLTLVDCTFARNQGKGGAGMFNSAASPTLNDCTFVENRARSGQIDAGGGGMLNRNGSSPELRRCTFHANQARTTGGAMFNDLDSNPTLSECTFTENVQTGGTMVIGSGAVDNTDSSPTLTDCTFHGNTAGDWGGAVGNYGDSNSIFVNCVFTVNSAERGGGMVNYGPSNATLIACTFAENAATSWGGGVYNAYNCSPTFIHCVFSLNTAIAGAGVANYWYCSPMLRDCAFTANEAYSAAGMFNFISCDPTLVNCTFVGNTARDAEGGGGAMVNSDANPVLVDCSFRLNSAVVGGAIASAGRPELTNCALTENFASSSGGAVYNWWGGSPILVNCTLSGNEAGGEGGGVFNEDAYNVPRLANCILWANVDTGGMDESAQLHGGAPVVDFSCIQGWTGDLDGTGNHGDDPLFVAPDGGDYHLRPGSPCIDAGDNTAVPPDSADLDEDGVTDEPTPFDLDGNPRFVDDPAMPDTGVMPPVDMGAYEFQVTRVSLDVRPGACPNWLKPDGPGVLLMAVVGTPEFDVTQIDPNSLVLRRADGVGGSAAPLMGPSGPKIRVEDVATPFDGEPCDCHELQGDGIDDLSMEFAIRDVVSALRLNELPGGTWVVWAELVVSGKLLDGTWFGGADCVSLVPPVPGSETPEPGSASQPPEPNMGLPAADSSQQDVDADRRGRARTSEQGDVDAEDDEDRRDAAVLPIVGCGSISPAFLLATLAATRLSRRW